MSWNMVEDESYDRAVAQLGTHQKLDLALEPIIYGLYNNPEGFFQTEIKGIFLAKTKLRFINSEIIPSYRLWFNLDFERHTIHKLWIDMAPPEDMGLWDEKDDSPF